MSEEDNKDAANMTVEQAVRLKQELNQSITYGRSNLNARQVTELQKIDAAQWAKIRLDYAEWIKGVRVNALVPIAIALMGVAMWLYFKNWIGIVGVVCAIYALGELFKREGHREGYIDGYDAGFEGGFNRALGIGEKEVTEIHERDTEMKIDDMSVAAFDKRREHS
jgi:hypothetical protein